MSAPERHRSTRVMIVDGSAVVRGLFARALESEPSVDVVSSVGDSAMALDMLQWKKVDIVLLDIESDRTDGLAVLPKLIAAQPGLSVIVTVSTTVSGGRASMRALCMGAIDYVAKPALRDQSFPADLLAKIRVLSPAGVHSSAGAGEWEPFDETRYPAIRLRPPGSLKPEAIAIGSSTGGPQALVKFIRSITNAIALPIFITQHMPAPFTAILAERLTQASGRLCIEARDGETVVEERLYLAPGGFHMLAEHRSGRRIVRLSDGLPENHCRPSVDPMLRSLAEAYGGAILVVMLTGMGRDGRSGSVHVVEAGGTIIAQDKATSVVWGMPGAVALDGLCSAVLPLDQIGEQVSILAA